MTPTRISELLESKPFEPFTILTGDGTAVDVLSKEFAWLKPGHRTLIVSVPRVRRPTDEADFEVHNIDVFLITKVITPAKRRVNGRSKKK